MSKNVSDDGFIDVILPAKFMSRMKYIGPDAFLVYAYIYSRVSLKKMWETDNLESWPGIRDISENVKIGEKRVSKAVNKLEYIGYLSIGRSFKKVHHYYIMPGIEKDRDFLLRCNQYCKLENARKGISDSAWPTVRGRVRIAKTVVTTTD